MKGLEYALWQAVEEGPGKYGRLLVTQKHVQTLKRLSDACAGWIVFDDETDETFLPLAEWLLAYQKNPSKQEFEPDEIAIPVARGDRAWDLLFSTIVIAFVIIAVWNLYNHTALITSGLWLVIVFVNVWTSCVYDVGMRHFIVNCLAVLSCDRYVKIAGNKICFSFRWFGLNFEQRHIALDKIVSVEWNAGQATCLARRDMADWSVCLWYDHDDPSKAVKRKDRSRKPNQDIYIIGPARRKDITEAFGRKIVQFLGNAGVLLIQIDEHSFHIDKKNNEVQIAE